MKWYKEIYINKQKYREHRVIMEQLIGRKLKADEVVHHIDGDRHNNSPNNLQLMKKGEHTSLHMTGWNPSEEWREKLRQANLGKRHTEETKQKISEAKLGTKLSEECKQKMSIARIGKTHTKQTKKKMSESCRECPRNSLLTKDDIPTIRKMLINNIPVFIIAFVYSVSKEAIYSIKQGRRWAWVK